MPFPRRQCPLSVLVLAGLALALLLQQQQQQLGVAAAAASLTRNERVGVAAVRSLLAARARVTNHLRVGKDCDKSCDTCDKKDRCTGSAQTCCWQDKSKDCSGSGDKSCNSDSCQGPGCITQSPTVAPTASPTTVFELAVLDTLNNDIDTLNQALEDAIPSTIEVNEGTSGTDSVNIGLCSAKYKYSAKVDDIDNLNSAEITSFVSVDSALAAQGTITILGDASVTAVKVTGSATASCGACGVSISESGDMSAKIDATGDVELTCETTQCLTSDNTVGFEISDCTSKLENVKTDIYDEKLSISNIPNSITNDIIKLFSSAYLTSAVEQELIDALEPTLESGLDTEINTLLEGMGCVEFS